MRLRPRRAEGSFRQATAVRVGAGVVVAAAVLALTVERLGTRRLMLSAGTAAFDERHGTWRHMFATGGLPGHAPVVVWVVALAALWPIGLPYVHLACAGLPDRGAALARPIALLLVGWITWWLVSLRVAVFGRAAIAAAAVLALLGALLLARAHRSELAAWLRRRWRLILVEELIFWGLFAAAAIVRYLNPDLWHPFRGGEKPMDLAYLDAVIKSAHFPPYDPWFAGGQINYYYFGFVLVAVLIKATAVEPAVAYNLAVPTFFAMLAAASFAATLALIPAGPRDLRGRGRLYAAGLGAVMVAVLGNIGELRVLAQRIHGEVPNDWWFWNASRLIHHPLGEAGPINEFPAFTYLYADLHAHALALPFDAVVLALALAVVGVTVREDPTPRRLRFFLLALVIGALWAINSWDVPVFFLVALVALALEHARRPEPWTAFRVTALCLRAVALAALAYVLFLPFHLHYRSVFAGLSRWHGSRTPFGDYLTIHALFLFAFGSAFLVELWTSPRASAVVRATRLAIREWSRFRRRRALLRVLVGRRAIVLTAIPVAVAFVTAGLVALGQPVAALGVLLTCLALGVVLGRRRVRPGPGEDLRRFATALFLLGLGLTVAVEYVVVAKIDVGRVNTLFKVYLQVWLIWSVAAAAAIAFVYGRLPLLPRVVRLAWRAALVCLLAAAALYPALAVPARIADRFDASVGHTLNGEAFMNRAVFQAHGVTFPLLPDRRAIDWVQRHVDGSPVVAEVSTDPALYAWGNRFAMFTGNPSIVGWDYHQRQQRPWQTAEIRRRIRDVQSAFRTSDPARADRLLRRYHVSYVVVGGLERAYFPTGAAKWSTGEGRYWTLVYNDSGTQIYRMADAG